MRPNFINKIKLPKVATKHPIAFWATVILHILLFWFIFFNSNIGRFELPKNNKPQKTFQTIKTDVADEDEVLNKFNAEKKRLNNIKKNRELKLKRDEKRNKELEDERYQQQRKINQLKAETKKKTETSKKETEIAKKETETAKKETETAKKETETAKKETETAKKEKEKIQQRRLDETKKFQTEQNKRELTKEIQDEETQERKIAQEDIFNTLKTSYVNQIASRVRSEWSYRGAEDDWACRVYILQDLNGNVQTVNVKDCNIPNNSLAKSFKNSIERAVQKASPLPSAPDKEVFENEILFHFKVN